jgi:hypothetical protein
MSRLPQHAGTLRKEALRPSRSRPGSTRDPEISGNRERRGHGEVDEQGTAIGFSVLQVSALKDRPLEVAL